MLGCINAMPGDLHYRTLHPPGHCMAQQGFTVRLNQFDPIWRIWRIIHDNKRCMIEQVCCTQIISDRHWATEFCVLTYLDTLSRLLLAPSPPLPWLVRLWLMHTRQDRYDASYPQDLSKLESMVGVAVAIFWGLENVHISHQEDKRSVTINIQWQ